MNIGDKMLVLVAPPSRAREQATTVSLTELRAIVRLKGGRELDVARTRVSPDPTAIVLTASDDG